MTPSIREALLPCPFCGGPAHSTPEISSANLAALVMCTDNDCATVSARTLAEAISRWNTRAALAAPPPDVVEGIAETLWRAEYRRATGKERVIAWTDVAESDQNKYRHSATAILASGLVTAAAEGGEAIDKAAAHIARLVSGYAWSGLRSDGRARDGGFDPWGNQSGITTNARQEDYRDLVRDVLRICGNQTPRDDAAIRADERERCAKIAERDHRSVIAKEVGYEPDFHKHAKFIAAAIRAGGEK